MRYRSRRHKLGSQGTGDAAGFTISPPAIALFLISFFLPFYSLLIAHTSIHLHFHVRGGITFYGSIISSPMYIIILQLLEIYNVITYIVSIIYGGRSSLFFFNKTICIQHTRSYQYAYVLINFAYFSFLFLFFFFF